MASQFPILIFLMKFLLFLLLPLPLPPVLPLLPLLPLPLRYVAFVNHSAPAAAPSAAVPG